MSRGLGDVYKRQVAMTAVLDPLAIRTNLATKGKKKHANMVTPNSVGLLNFIFILQLNWFYVVALQLHNDKNPKSIKQIACQ